jgi:HK97 family phage major capsid protein
MTYTDRWRLSSEARTAEARAVLDDFMIDAAREHRHRQYERDVERKMPPRGDVAGVQIAERRHQRAFMDYLKHGAESPLHDELVRVDAERRDLGSGTNSAGGFTTPPLFERRIHTAVKRYSSMIRACNVIPTVGGDPMSFPTADDTGNVGAILAENTAPTVQDITFNQKTLSAFMYTSKPIKASFQLMQDTGVSFEAWLGRRLGERIGRAVNAHFTNGTGGGTQPTGLVPNATVGVTGSAGSTTSITYTNVVAMIESVNPEYLEPLDVDDDFPSGHVGWMGRAETLSMLRRVLDSSGAPIVVEGRPPMVLGYPFMINPDMPVPAASARSLLFGNLGAAYSIRRVSQDMTVLRLDERAADALQTYFIGFARYDGTPDDAAACRVYVNSAT